MTIQSYKPIPHACDAWLKIADKFDWNCYAHQPDMLTMPHFEVGQDKWFINFCPACGKPARNRNVRVRPLEEYDGDKLVRTQMKYE